MMRDIKRLLRSKKGAAIEMAIFLMLIVFLFSTLITVFCLSAHTTYKRQQDRMTEAAQIDSFGEEFVKSNDRKNFTINNEAYKAEVSDDEKTLTVTDAKGGRVRLIVTVGDDGKVKSWRSFNQSAETTAATVETTATNTPENQD